MKQQSKSYTHYLKPIWITVSVLLLLLVFIFDAAFSFNESYESIEKQSNRISNRTDKLVNNLLQSVYTLPISSPALDKCTPELTEGIHRILINNPRISAIIIKNNNNAIICSSLSKKDSIHTTNRQSRALLGPFTLHMFDNPVYLIQQKFNNYYIQIAVIEPVLKNSLHVTEYIASRVVLRRPKENTPILTLTYTNGHIHWYHKLLIRYLSTTESDTLYATSNIENLPDTDVVVYAKHAVIFKTLWHNLVLFVLLFVTLSTVLYFRTKKFLTNHYSLERAMQRGLENNHFYPLYQPIFDTQENRYAGAEVLMRWQDSDGTTIMPDYFISEAESNGMIVPMTIYIIEAAFRESQKLLHENPYFHLSFNLSHEHFKKLEFFTKFYALVERYSINPSQILLEITERKLIDSNDQSAIDAMNNLRKNGYSLAIDDFGTGHASINYLHIFPFNYLKIDKIFVQAIGTKALTETLIDAILTMSKNLNLMVIAEGVETKEQLDYLKHYQVRYIQGWYFAKAMPMNELDKLISQQGDLA